MKRHWLSLLMLAFAALATLPAAAAEKIRLAITDVDGLEALQRDFGAFRDALQGCPGKIRYVAGCMPAKSGVS